MVIFGKKEVTMRTTRIFVLFSCLVLAIASCQYEICRDLDLAESLLRQRPDSALVILRSLGSDDLRSKEEQARYALLLSVAYDKNYIDVESDSLISIALDYYTSMGSDRNRMLAWYYQGIVLKNAQEFIPAIIAFEKAEHYAHAVKDDLYTGLICRNKGYIFSQTNNIPAAIESIKDAIHSFENAGEEKYKIYAELSLITAYTIHTDNDKADSLIQCIRVNCSDSTILHYCDIRQAGIYVARERNLEEALSLYRKTPQPYFGLLDYSYCALVYEICSMPDSANHWLSKGYSVCIDQADSATIDFMKSKVEMRRGHFETAFHLVVHAARVQDSLTRTLLQQSVSSAQRDYYKNETLRQEERVKLMRKRGIADGIIALLVFALTGGILFSLNREKDRKLKEQMARLALKEHELERIHRDNAHLIGSLFSERISRLDKLSRDYFRLEDKAQKDRIYREVKQNLVSLQKDDGLFVSLEKDLNRYCNGIMEKLRTQVPKIKGENLKIIALFFAGYPYETVQLLLNKVSVDSLKTARSRYRKEILEAKAPDSAFFLEMLEMKRRSQTDTNESGDC